MEHVNGVIGRIQAIEARVGVATPATGDFRRVLTRAAAGGSGRAATPTAAGNRTMQMAASAVSSGSVSLAQMLGRPVTDATSPATPRPVDGPVQGRGDGSYVMPVSGRLSSRFGPRVHPITGELRPHRGLDLAAPTGTPIGAMAAGTVTFAGDRGGYGNVVIIDHGDGTETRYAHQDRMSVTVGQTVVAGETIGTVGSTGLSTGPHLHLELRRDGEAVDPAPLLGL